MKDKENRIVLKSSITEYEFNEKYWKYYLLLEKEFFDLTYYIPIDDCNSETFSVAYLKLLLAIGSEFDVICKNICKLFEKGNKNWNIAKYRKIFNNDLSEFYNVNVLWVDDNKTIDNPLQPFNDELNPNFWVVYNAVKHNRTDSENFKNPNQNIILNALSSLYIVERIFAFINTTYLSNDGILLNGFNFAKFKSERLYIKEFDSINVYKLRSIFEEIKKKTNLIFEVANN